MEKRFTRNNALLAALLVCVAAVGRAAEPAASANDPIHELPSRVKKITLKNGMRVLMMERPESPTVSFTMYIRTGGLDDDSGRTGLAHMFEHMLFKGTKTIGTKDYPKEKGILEKIDAAVARLQRERAKGRGADPEAVARLESELQTLEQEAAAFVEEEEFWRIYERAGAQDFNAATGYDFTNYTISLPVNQVPLWMAMESDRLVNPVLREFYKERSVVLEERRMRVDTSPRGKLWEAFLAAAFMAHPYGRPILGWEADISRVTRGDAEAFFREHYDISRLVLAVVGGFETDAMELTIRRSFEGIPSRNPEPVAPATAEPPQEGERRIAVLFDAEPSLLIGYHRPDMTHPDSAALDVAADVLSSGRTSRFYRTIVEKKKLAVSAWAGSSAPGERDPNLFIMGGQPRSPHTAEELEKALVAELEKLRAEGPTTWELEKVKNNLEAGVIGSLDSNLGMANQLGYYEAVAGDWTTLLTIIDRIRAVTADDVKAVLARYAVPENKTVAVVRRK